MARRSDNGQADGASIHIGATDADLREPGVAGDRCYRERPLVEIGILRWRGNSAQCDARRRRYDQPDAVSKHRANTGSKRRSDRVQRAVSAGVIIDASAKRAAIASPNRGCAERIQGPSVCQIPAHCTTR